MIQFSKMFYNQLLQQKKIKKTSSRWQRCLPNVFSCEYYGSNIIFRGQSETLVFVKFEQSQPEYQNFSIFYLGVSASSQN